MGQARPRPGGGLPFNVSVGDPVDLYARHGILPTKVVYPTVTTNGVSSKPNSIRIRPLLCRAVYRKYYVERYDSNYTPCQNLLGSKGAWGEEITRLMQTDAKTLQLKAVPYTGAVYPKLEQLDNTAQKVGLSNGEWGANYFNVVREDMIKLGNLTDSDGPGCVDPRFISNTWTYGLLCFLLRFAPPENSTATECFKLSVPFVEEYNALPLNLTENEQSYIDFCEKEWIPVSRGTGLRVQRISL